MPVSYTHLDVYKRQLLMLMLINDALIGIICTIVLVIIIIGIDVYINFI